MDNNEETIEHIEKANRANKALSTFNSPSKVVSKNGKINLSSTGNTKVIPSTKIVPITESVKLDLRPPTPPSGNPKLNAASNAWGKEIDFEKFIKYTYKDKLYYIDEDAMGEIYDGETKTSIGETIVIDGIEYEFDLDDGKFVEF